MNPVIHLDARGLDRRIQLIAERIDTSITQPQPNGRGGTYMLKDFAHEIVRGTPQHGVGSELDPIQRVFQYVRTNIEYRQDPADYDYFMSAGRAINSGSGDCDDHCILACSLLSSIGYTTGARVISPDGNGWHIYSIVGVNPAFNGLPTEVIPFDTTQADSDRLGWEPPTQYRAFEKQCTFREGRAVGMHWRSKG